MKKEIFQLNVPGIWGFIQPVEGLAKLGNMFWKLWMYIVGRLLHVYLFVEGVMEESIVDINLAYGPIFRERNGDKAKCV